MSPPRPRFAPDLFELDARDVPAVVAIDNFYRANAGDVLNIPASRGVLSNDFSSISAEAVLTATLIGQPVQGAIDADGDGLIDILANPLPANTLTLNPDGSFTLIVPSNLPATINGIAFTYLASNASNPLDPPGVGQVIVFTGQRTADRFAVAPQVGAAPIVNVFEAGSGQLIQSFAAYEESFTGGVRVAVADFNGDGVPDVATAPGEGGGPRIKIFDGRTGRMFFDVFVFDPAFTGGAYVAAGDVNGDGFPDLIIGAGNGGGPRVVVANGQGLVPFQPGGAEPFAVPPLVDAGSLVIVGIDPLMDFFAYEPSFRGGVKVAGGDVAGVGRDFVITAPAAGGGPVVKTFDFNTVVGPPNVNLAGGPSNAVSIRLPINTTGLNAGGTAVPALSFVAGDATRRQGVNVAAGDVLGDGRAEIITGDATGPAVVSIFDGTTGGLISQFGVPFQQTPTGNTGIGANGLLGGTLPPTGLLLGIQRPNTLIPSQDNGIRVDGALVPSPNGNLDINAFALGGVTVGTVDYDGDGKIDILAGAGPGNSPRVRITRGDGSVLNDFLAFPANVLTGVFVG